jgi:hypothetical protein
MGRIYGVLKFLIVITALHLIFKQELTMTGLWVSGIVFVLCELFLTPLIEERFR